MTRNNLILTLILLVLGCSCTNQPKSAEAKINYFELGDVKLSPSPFCNAMKLDEAWLLQLDPDRLLSGFRLESGLSPKASKYGGWESLGVAGQSFGHYLSACAMMYAVTENKELLNQIEYCMDELVECQKSMGNGLVAGFPRAKELFEEVRSGDIRTKGFDLNGGWVPLYNMHKLIVGLTDVCHYTNNEKAHSVLINLAGYFDKLFGNLSDEQIQTILISEHGGINEAFVYVYNITNDKKYLDLSLRLNHKAILDPLSQGIDDLCGKHANTQIPKVIGCIQQYNHVKDDRLYKTADFFWNTVVHSHSYVIGGNSEAEHFGVPNKTYDRITDKTCENCNTYNMLKLTKYLFALNPSSEKTDFYERALYNQILGSQHPETGMVCYMSPLATGSKKHFSTPFDSFWCCVGSGFENHARYGEFIYHTDSNDNLFVNLFIPTELNWRKRDIGIIQTTHFPESDSTSITVKTKKEQQFTINLRIPGWAKSDIKVLVNNKIIPIDSGSIINGYVSIDRVWQDNDVITYTMPQSFYSEAALGDNSMRAYLYGPIVLSAKVPENVKFSPVVINDNFETANIEKHINSDGSSSFFMKNSYPENLELYPYYKSADNPISVYFPHFKKDTWEKEKENFLAKQNYDQWLKDLTVSHFQLGQMQPERDHNLTGVNMENPETIEGRTSRKAVDGGELSFIMDVLPNKPMDMICTFWGDLGDIYKFDILVEEQSIATVIIHWWGREFIDKTYKIPESLTKGKDKINVKLKAIDKNNIAGPIFECRIIAQNNK